MKCFKRWEEGTYDYEIRKAIIKDKLLTGIVSYRTKMPLLNAVSYFLLKEDYNVHWMKVNYPKLNSLAGFTFFKFDDKTSLWITIGLHCLINFCK
jgi:hypothetical protein